MILIKHKSDILGAIASGLCLIHCIATPLLFIAQTQAVCCTLDAPVLWKSLDYVFLTISFIAVYLSTSKTTKKWIGFTLWISWFVLFLVILNEKIRLIPLPDYSIYFPSLSLVFFHYYNLKYCKCKKDECCIVE